ARHILLPDVGGIGQRGPFAGAVTGVDLAGAAEGAGAYLAKARGGTGVISDRGVVGPPGVLFEAPPAARPPPHATRAAPGGRYRRGGLSGDVRVVADGEGLPLPACPDLAAAAGAALSILRTLACQ